MSIDALLKNKFIEGLSALATIVLVVLVYLFGKHSEIFESSYHMLHVVLALLFIYTVIVSVHRFYAVLKRQEREKSFLGFSGMTKRYKCALGATGREIKDDNGIPYLDKKVSADDLKEIVYFAHHAWDYNDKREKLRSIEWRKSYIERLFGINQDVFRLLMMNNELIGYVSIIPMKSAEHFAGLKSQYDFDASDVSADKRSMLVYIQAIWVRDDSRDKKPAYELAVSTLIRQIGAAVSPGATLYAEQFTASGEKLLSKMGFTKTTRLSKGGHSYWELPTDVSRLSEGFPRRSNAEMTINAINKIV